ncbi:DUF222 domain-containing protein [Microbacterium sp. STN6]|uniref:HNH endonuclease signature motif containing protein n=1 Tax=Microbacterium sp. STN6 TaxID=2995588 RepID=UPI002260E86F|nr:HNH endonuclease signature motif containing protein [Microbacterium sp. STN6]MCX7522564.1 DUF222 domain-containing protein [Microbacterium sp. STN6]
MNTTSGFSDATQLLRCGDGRSADARALTDDELIAETVAVEELGRLVDARRLVLAAEIAHRSRRELAGEGLAARRGCRNPNELLQRLTLAGPSTVEMRMRLGACLRRRPTLTGADAPALFPAVASAVADGTLGADAAAAIVAALRPVLNTAHPAHIASAESELVAAATGAAPESPAPATAEDIRLQAQVWAAALDPDGVLREEEKALTRRGVRLGRPRDGVVPLSGALMPEIAAKMARLFDAYLTPRTGPAFLADDEGTARSAREGDLDARQRDPRSLDQQRDPRSLDQQRHDVLAAMIDAAARATDAPTIGGAAPTVLVSVRAGDLATGRGIGHIDGSETPVSMTTVKQFACTGGIQPIHFDDTGRITGLGSPQRCFTPKQRRGIELRDGGCVIPGCHVPAAWTEIHHVTPDRAGGPTHTDNGVCLCWYHHRTIDTSGWHVRMHHGTPHIKAPPWLNPSGQWKPATKSVTRLLSAVSRQ